MLRHSLLNEIPLLTEYSKRAFASDIDFGGEGGGPEGYDLIEWHRMQFEKRNLYSLVIHDAVEAEAVLEKREDSLFIQRNFVNPDHFQRGYGRILMNEIEDLFSDCERFTLDTPEWNRRTNVLYQKMGYRKIGMENGAKFNLVLYAKDVKC